MVKWTAIAAVVSLSLGLALVLGPAEIGMANALFAVAGRGEEMAVVIVRQLRLPRALLAFSVGGSLAVTGAALQALVRNLLAEPYLLGLSGGAGLGAVLAIGAGFSGLWGVPLAATVGALGAVVLVYRLAVVSGNVLDTRVLLFAGVVVSSFSVAVMGAILAVSPASELRNAMLWVLGGFDRASWTTLSIFAVYGCVPLFLLYRLSHPLDLISLGEEPARHLGVDVESVKRWLYVLASILTAAAVAVSGIIGFVGLIIPHAVRMIWGHIHRSLLPAAFLLGGALMTGADTVARTIFAPVELPVGSVTALIGVPVFAVLVRRWAN